MGLVLAAGGLGVGIGMGAAIGWLMTRRVLLRAKRRAAATLEATEGRAAEVTQRAETRRAEERRALRSELEADIAREQQELTDYAAELDARESLLTSRDEEAQTYARDLDDEQQRVDELQRQATELRQAADDSSREHRRALEQAAGSSWQEALASSVHDRIGRAELQSQMRLREIENDAARDAAQEARRILGVVVDRYSGTGHLDRIASAIAVPDAATREALVDPEGPAQRAFVDAVGCELLGEEGADTVTVRGDDPLAREIARRVLRQVANRSIRSPDTIRSLAATVRHEVEHEVQNAGRKALRTLAVGKVHPDILNLIGRLKYRLSYSQNQLKHAIEVGYFAGMLAEELGMDPKVAQRGGLLHDIGKAMTHDHEGSHAVLGADVARRCGESELIANAIGAHHNDESPESTVALVVAAADAMSGARPGARRESVTAYLERIRSLQHIAGRSSLVSRVDIMHAGREVRVIVADDERGEIDSEQRSRDPVATDADLYPLAQDIARRIEEELTFAGQIRVTVIRESRSVAIAR